MKLSTILCSFVLLAAAPANADNIRKPVGRALMGNSGNGFGGNGGGFGNAGSDPQATLESVQCETFFATLEEETHAIGELPLTDLFSALCTEESRLQIVEGVVGMDMGTKPRNYGSNFPAVCNQAYDRILLSARDVIYTSMTSASACEAELRNEIDHLKTLTGGRRLEKITLAVIGLATASIGLATAIVTATST